MKMNKPNPFEIAKKQLDETAKILDLNSKIIEFLKTPRREFAVLLKIQMDDGSTKKFQGFRIQYNDARGPTKGGIRFHPEETVDTVRALAAWMTWKTALLDLPLGGAKGGIICNPKEMSQNELERLSRAYVRALAEHLGPDRDVPAPDVYTNAQIMAWMMDEYSKITGEHQPGVVTGKPVELGGSLGRNDATARGGMYAVREAAKELNIRLAKSRIAIQGFGNAGYNAAKLLKDNFGCAITAISDSKGGIVSDRCLDPEKLREHKVKTGSVINFPGAKNISNEEILELDVDILVPAAMEDVITKDNAPKIKTRILAELANGPTTPEADDILRSNHVHVIPDILCNAGGVTVSYFEMAQNKTMDYWTEEEVHAQLDKKMTLAYYSVLETSKKYKINMRQAAYVIAVKRVVEAMRLRGWI